MVSNLKITGKTVNSKGRRPATNCLFCVKCEKECNTSFLANGECKTCIKTATRAATHPDRILVNPTTIQVPDSVVVPTPTVPAPAVHGLAGSVVPAPAPNGQLPKGSAKPADQGSEPVDTGRTPAVSLPAPIVEAEVSAPTECAKGVPVCYVAETGPGGMAKIERATPWEAVRYAEISVLPCDRADLAATLREMADRLLKPVQVANAAESVVVFEATVEAVVAADEAAAIADPTAIPPSVQAATPPKVAAHTTVDTAKLDTATKVVPTVDTAKPTSKRCAGRTAKDEPCMAYAKKGKTCCKKHAAQEPEAIAKLANAQMTIATANGELSPKPAAAAPTPVMMVADGKGGFRPATVEEVKAALAAMTAK